jgi:hypothetical protein
MGTALKWAPRLSLKQVKAAVPLPPSPEPHLKTMGRRSTAPATRRAAKSAGAPEKGNACRSQGGPKGLASLPRRAARVVEET